MMTGITSEENTSIPDVSLDSTIIQIIQKEFSLETGRLEEFLSETILKKLSTEDFNKDTRVIEKLEEIEELRKIKKALSHTNRETITSLGIRIDSNNRLKLSSPIVIQKILDAFDNLAREVDISEEKPKKAGRKEKRHRNFALLDTIIDSFCFINTNKSTASTNDKFYFSGLVIAAGKLLFSPTEFEAERKFINYKDYREYLTQNCKSIIKKTDSDTKWVSIYMHIDDSSKSESIVLESLKELWPKDNNLINNVLRVHKSH